MSERPACWLYAPYVFWYALCIFLHLYIYAYRKTEEKSSKFVHKFSCGEAKRTQKALIRDLVVRCRRIVEGYLVGCHLQPRCTKDRITAFCRWCGPVCTISLWPSALTGLVLQLGWGSVPLNLRPWLLVENRWMCPLQVGNDSLPQMKEVVYLGVFYMSEGTKEHEFGQTIGAPKAVLCSLSWTVVTKRELSQRAKL